MRSSGSCPHSKVIFKGSFQNFIEYLFLFLYIIIECNVRIIFNGKTFLTVRYSFMDIFADKGDLIYKFLPLYH